MRWMRIAAFVLVAGGAVTAWFLWSNRPPEVTVVAASRGEAAEIVYATGVIEPESWAKVTPVRRGRIVESCNCEGEPIEAGKLLFRLDDGEVKARVEEMRSRLELAQIELARTTGLFERGVATREKYDQLLAQVAELRAGLAAAESQLLDLEIRAPLGGQVLRIEGDVGEVAELGEALAWVGQPTPLRVIADVNEEDIPLVLVGQDALLKADAFPGRMLEATVSSITPMGDPDLKTYRVRLDLPGETPLRIGMSVDVNIVIRLESNAILVPAPALVGDAVQVVGVNGAVELRPVEIGVRGADAVQVTAGLEVGERVISPAIDGLATGDKIRTGGAEE